MLEGQKFRGKLPCGEFHEGNWPGRNYSGVIIQGAKVRMGNCPGGELDRGRLSGDSCSGGIIQGLLSSGEKSEGNCPGWNFIEDNCLW